MRVWDGPAVRSYSLPLGNLVNSRIWPWILISGKTASWIHETFTVENQPFQGGGDWIVIFQFHFALQLSNYHCRQNLTEAVSHQEKGKVTQADIPKPVTCLTGEFPNSSSSWLSSTKRSPSSEIFSITSWSRKDGADQMRVQCEFSVKTGIISKYF